MKKLFVDLDDTYVDTERYLRKLLIANGYDVPKYDTVYTCYMLEGYKFYFDQVFSNYHLIPKKQGVAESIKLLETEYEIIFCSYCTTKEEGIAKKKYADSLGKEIILCRGDDWGKSSVNMSDGILIDDNPEVILKANADRKIQMYNEYNYIQKVSNDLVFDWFDITDKLMEVSVDEELRAFLYKGVQRSS